MLPAYWEHCTIPNPMINECLKENVSPRKWRLFACAVARMAWPYLGTVSRKATEIAEEYTDNPDINFSESLINATAVRDNSVATFWYAADIACCTLVGIDAHSFCFSRDSSYLEVVSGKLQCMALRDLMPRQLITIQSTDMLRDLALGAYNNLVDNMRLDPVRLSVLCDALKDNQIDEEVPCGGRYIRYVMSRRTPNFWECQRCGNRSETRLEQCTNRILNPILSHFESGIHFRGCWAIDAILGRE